ncbi:MAG: GNAT family N-acetyltransferase [Pleurocapsa sp.]
MQVEIKIRPVKSNDLPELKLIIDANCLFPSDMLDEMISEYFENDNSKDYWITYEEDKLVGLAYYAPERMAEGTWNLYLIAVHPDYQGQGRGASMVSYVEQMLAKNGERVLLVETSGLPSFESTQSFYRKCGFEQEAIIREFYQAGEDKLVFRKSLTDAK